MAVQLAVCFGLPDLSAKVLTFRQPSPGRLISLLPVSRRVLDDWFAARWCCVCTPCHCMAEVGATMCFARPSETISRSGGRGTRLPGRPLGVTRRI